MKIESNEYLEKEHDIEESIPHVTLMVAETYEQKHIGSMMVEAEKAIFTPVKENPAIWVSEDQQFIRIVISAHGQGQPQAVQMTHESICSAKLDSDAIKKTCYNTCQNICGLDIALILDW